MTTATSPRVLFQESYRPCGYRHDVMEIYVDLGLAYQSGLWRIHRIGHRSHNGRELYFDVAWVQDDRPTAWTDLHGYACRTLAEAVRRLPKRRRPAA